MNPAAIHLVDSIDLSKINLLVILFAEYSSPSNHVFLETFQNPNKSHIDFVYRGCFPQRLRVS
jgi:hypothetical protein